MKLILAGGTGFIGQCLQHHFHNHEIVVLGRRKHRKHDRVKFAVWDGRTLGAWAKHLDGADALINLTGKSVNCRYNERNKKAIIDSRTQSTAILGKAIAACKHPPKVWLNAASATIYRHATDRSQDELTGELGTGFSVEVCQVWERTFFEQNTPHTRKVALRTAIALADPKGGHSNNVLRQLRRLARMGLGGRQGPGTQMMSWVHQQDVCRAVEFLIHQTELSGPFNIAAPGPVPNSEFMQQVARQWGPGFALREPKWLLELGARIIGTETELVLKSRWVVPTRLEQAGFVFDYPTVERAFATFR